MSSSLYDQLNQIHQQNKLSTPNDSTTTSKFGFSSPTQSTIPLSQSSSNKIISKATPDPTPKSPSKALNQEPPKLYDTKLVTISRDKIIWAPFYRFHDKLFCARLCDNTEAILDPKIHYPIPDDEAVVEILCKEQMSTETKLTLVKKNKICPFWAQKAKDHLSDYIESEQTEWNLANLKKMEKALQDKYPKYYQMVYDTIVKKAEAFLELSLNKDKEELKESKKRSLSQDESQPSTSQPSMKKGRKSNTEKSGLQELALKSPSTVECLKIGDSISYFHKVFTDKIITTVITGFSDDPSQPLLLKDDFPLGKLDIIGKVYSNGKQGQFQELQHFKLFKGRK